MSIYAIYFYIPVYFQVLGYSATQSGIRLIVAGLGGAWGALATGIILKRTGRYYILDCCLWCVYLLATALICTLQLDSLWWSPYLYLFLFGVGFGGTFVIALLALIASVQHSEQALATSISYVFRSTGSTLGITIASVVGYNPLIAFLWGMHLTHTNCRSSRTFLEVSFRSTLRTSLGPSEIQKILDNFHEIYHCPDEWYDDVRGSYMAALRGVWGTILGLTVLAATASLMMREHKLHSDLARSSGPQETAVQSQTSE
jgi:MFS family permease